VRYKCRCLLGMAMNNSSGAKVWRNGSDACKQRRLIRAPTVYAGIFLWFVDLCSAFIGCLEGFTLAQI
jgi:hypothetical protein